jgi:hypothetical protein
VRPVIRTLARAAAIAAVCLIPLACAKQSEESRNANRSAVREAYTLLDHGQINRAIAVLEPVVDQEPDNHEARLMLASAYMGKAGIDVMSIHAAFHDVLFSKSLSEVLTSKKPATEALAAGELPAQRKSARETPVEAAIRKIDEFLNTVRRTTVIFNRFPHVAEKNWPLVDQALSHLDRLPNVGEVRVYRLFIRMVYLKEFLTNRIVRDPSFGTHDWACSLEVSDLQDGLNWSMSIMGRASDDFVTLYPTEASPFAKAHAIFSSVAEALDNVQKDAPVGVETGAQVAQRRLREALKCEQ